LHVVGLARAFFSPKFGVPIEMAFGTERWEIDTYFSKWVSGNRRHAFDATLPLPLSFLRGGGGVEGRCAREPPGQK